jgi:hypothetical protein
MKTKALSLLEKRTAPLNERATLYHSPHLGSKQAPTREPPPFAFADSKALWYNSCD